MQAKNMVGPVTIWYFLPHAGMHETRNPQLGGHAWQVGYLVAAQIQFLEVGNCSLRSRCGVRVGRATGQPAGLSQL